MNDSNPKAQITIHYHPHSTPPHLAFGGVGTSVYLSPDSVPMSLRLKVTPALTNGWPSGRGVEWTVKS